MSSDRSVFNEDLRVSRCPANRKADEHPGYVYVGAPRTTIGEDWVKGAPLRRFRT